MKNTWQLQDAKNRFSAVVNEALEHGPQTITRHGVETVVVLSIQEYRQRFTLKKSGENLVDFLLNSPLQGSDLNIERDKDEGRDIDL